MTGRVEPKEAPAWQRLAFRYLVSFPIIGLCLALVFAVMFAMLQLQVYKRNANKKNPQKMKRKINFPLFTYFNHSFHLFAYLICFDIYAFTCFQTLTKFYSVCPTGFVAIYIIPMQKTLIHSLE